MNTTMQSVRVGLFFIFGLAILFVAYQSLSDNPLNTESGYTLTADFPDIKLIAPGDDVRMAGVRIGSVSDTRLVDGQARLTLNIDPDFSIPADSTATILTASLLGQNYIGIKYGTAATPALNDGDAIDTIPATDFNDIIEQISGIGERIDGIAASFDALGGEDTENLFANLNSIIDDNRPRIENALTNIEEITNTLNSTEGTLGKLLNDPEAYDHLIAAVDEIQAAATNANTLFSDAQDSFEGINELVANVQEGEGTLGRLMADDALATQLDETVANLRAFSESLNDPNGTLGRLITDDTLYLELQSLLERAERSLDSIGDSGPITAVGVAANSLF